MHTRKNVKGAHIHVPIVLITAFVAVPLFPAHSQGVKLESKRFEITDDCTAAEAESLAKKFVYAANTGGEKYWLMTKGIKTSKRIDKPIRNHR